MKIYTKTGDAGETALYGGERRGKDDPRVAAYGAVDELQAFIGVVMSRAPQLLDDLIVVLNQVQYDTYIACCQLARPATMDKPGEPQLMPERVTWLEQTIDHYEGELPPLRTFIVQGGSPTGAELHLARTVCRRAERAITTLISQEVVDPVCLQYFNRLSDLLFVLARVANCRTGTPETPLHFQR